MKMGALRMPELKATVSTTRILWKKTAPGRVDSAIKVWNKPLQSSMPSLEIATLLWSGDLHVPVTPRAVPAGA